MAFQENGNCHEDISTCKCHDFFQVFGERNTRHLGLGLFKIKIKNISNKNLDKIRNNYLVFIHVFWKEKNNVLTYFNHDSFLTFPQSSHRRIEVLLFEDRLHKKGQLIYKFILYLISGALDCLNTSVKCIESHLWLVGMYLSFLWSLLTPLFVCLRPEVSSSPELWASLLARYTRGRRKWQWWW